jgi:predicted RNase H-like HicB family nuclease
MEEYIFKVIIEPDGEKWHAYCPVLEEKGASTYGNTLDEAFENIKEVLYITLENMKQHKEKIPSERKIREKAPLQTKGLKNAILYSEIPVQLSGQY